MPSASRHGGEFSLLIIGQRALENCKVLSMRSILYLAGSLLAVLSCVSPDGARAEDAGVAADAGTVDSRTDKIEALRAGALDVAVDPQNLFDVSLADEAAVQLEIVRIGALLRSIEESERPAAPPAAPARSGRKPRETQTSEGLDASVRLDLAGVDLARWSARIGLDRARLAFYTLSEPRRNELLREHEAQQEAAKPKETAAARIAREADQERQQALQAALAARSEAERLVAEELARLIGVQGRVTAEQEKLNQQHEALSSRRDEVLRWQRRVRDAKAGPTADATYDALRKSLRSSRDQLADALDQLSSSSSGVPALGADALQGIPAEVASEQAAKRRIVVQRQIKTATAQEVALREERAATLLEETNVLNRERLGLLPHLTAGKRGAITGLTAAGADQARSEARQLLLILRYHRHVAIGWMGLLQHRDGLRETSVWHVFWVSVPWLILLALFSSLRRRSPGLLALLERRVADQDRAERRTLPSPARRAVHFARGVHRPMEWLALFWLGLWLLPASAQSLLEVQLVSVIVGWSLGASLVVDVINGLANIDEQSVLQAIPDEASRLRLRSLRLVGRVVVAFALVLFLSARLVGEGTLYSWVSFTCWFAAIPVFLVLVRWWRETVFVRMDRARKKTPLQAWILANRDGWQSFLAAMIGAVQLFALGALKTGRNWLARFTLTRRADAYLFKRELDRMAGEKVGPSRPLSEQARASLSPERASAAWVSCPADEQLTELNGVLAAGRGGIIAIVGSRGIGKSSLLRRLAESSAGRTAIVCGAETNVQTVRVALAASRHQEPVAVLLDDADALIKPVQGGLHAFDQLLTEARAGSAKTLWVFVIDAVIWPFLRRARDARPLFDRVLELHPWTDEQIGALLTQRSREAEISPSFEDLLEKLPPSADEIDRLEALQAKRAGYIRVVWDYARGNPSIALEVWRSSLVEDARGNARARPLQAPPSAQLEQLSDTALFILRAVLQLAPASPAEVAQATRLSEAQVRDAFAVGVAQGYLVERPAGVDVTWAWLRLVLLLLERRHLLVSS